MEHIRRHPAEFLFGILQTLVDLSTPEGQDRSRALMEVQPMLEPVLRQLAADTFQFTGETALDPDSMTHAMDVLHPVFIPGRPRLYTRPVSVAAPIDGTFTPVRRDADAKGMLKLYGSTFLTALRAAYPHFAAKEQTPAFRLIRDALALVRGSLKEPLRFHADLPLPLSVVLTDTFVGTLTLGLGLLVAGTNDFELEMSEKLLYLAMHYVIAVPALAALPDKDGDRTWLLFTSPEIAALYEK